MTVRSRTTSRPRAIVTFPRRLLAGVLIGVGTIFGSKAERDQHWSIPPTMVADRGDQQATADGDDPDDPSGEHRPTRLPACA